MRAVHKFPATTAHEQTISMSENAEILCVDSQYEHPCIWAVVASDEPPIVPRRFVTYATGEQMEGTSAQYVGTYQLHGGSLVYHVFEVTAPTCA